MKSGQEMYTSSHTLSARQEERLKEAKSYKDLAEEQRKEQEAIDYLAEEMVEDLIYLLDKEDL